VCLNNYSLSFESAVKILYLYYGQQKLHNFMVCAAKITVPFKMYSHRKDKRAVLNGHADGLILF
jgi:hypothetical protein